MSSTELTTLSEALHYGRHASGCVIIDWRTPRSGRHRTLDHDGHECEPWMFDMVRPGDSLHAAILPRMWQVASGDTTMIDQNEVYRRVMAHPNYAQARETAEWAVRQITAAQNRMIEANNTITELYKAVIAELIEEGW